MPRTKKSRSQSQSTGSQAKRAMSHSQKTASGKKGGMGVNSIAAGTVGAVVGAAAGVLLSDQKTRNALGDTFTKVATKASEIADKASEKAPQLKEAKDKLVRE